MGTGKKGWGRCGGERRGASSIDCIFVLGVAALAGYAGFRVHEMNESDAQKAREAALEEHRALGPLGVPAVPKGTSTLAAPRPTGGGIASGRLDDKDLAETTHPVVWADLDNRRLRSERAK